jgi:hypothetical protein
MIDAPKPFEYLTLTRQVPVTVNDGARRYVLDFSVRCLENDLFLRGQGRPIPKIAVELDGHDFHEHTRAQVDLRNHRDRDLASDGRLCD